MPHPKWWTYVLLRRARNAFIVRTRPWVMGRIACLGQDVRRLLGQRFDIINTQKGRVDQLVEFGANPRLRPRTGAIRDDFKRQDIVQLIAQQELFAWHANNPPVGVFMDSFSELTDQLFTNRRD